MGLKRGRNYDPELDRQAKVDELRRLHKATSERSGKEEDGDGESGEIVPEKVSAYFEWEKTKAD